MELWIRSQDRESLIKADNLGLFGNRIVFIPNRPTGGRMTIGTYKTEQRALEVLDEIQKHITINATITGNYEEQDTKIKSLMLGYQIRIFEMPEK